MEKPTARFLNISLVLVALFCALVLAGQALCVNLMGESAIRQLGIFYMSGISEQASAHFGTIIELRLSQVESLVNAVPPGRAAGESAMRIGLTYNARSVGFEYLALYTEDGSFRMIYGSQVAADDPEELRRSVQGGRYSVCSGTDAGGTAVVLVGVPAVYSLEDGASSVALVAGLPATYLSETLESSIQSGFMEYAIIRTDGSYVLNNTGGEERSYFQRVEALYETCGKTTPERHAQLLREALEAGRDYTDEVLLAGEHWNLYCTGLPSSEWYLLLQISQSALDETVNILQREWSWIAVGGGALILLALLLVFAGYCRLTRMHIRALEEARQAAERSNRAKNEFLSNMSHDIRTPMNGIMGMTAIAIGSLEDPARVHSCLKRIRVSSRHLLGLINDMLDMSKIETGELTLRMEPVSLVEVMGNIQSVIGPQAREKGQSFRVYIHGVAWETVRSDRVRLGQILLNVIGNAVKFTPEGGTIRADLWEEPSLRGAGYVRSVLDIRDNGIGMSPEFLAHIFDAFAREDRARVAKEAGAGMGLTITKYIVDAMGGDIAVESEQGKGSCFRIAVDMEKVPEPEELPLPEGRVLVLDSDRDEGRLAAEALASLGLRSDAAGNLAEALERVREAREQGDGYRLVLLDRAAGEPSALAEAGLTVVLLAGDDWEEVPEAGALPVIARPLFRSSLRAALRPLLEAEAPAGKDPAARLWGKRILIAEDNELNWEIASELLRESGLEAEWAENGQMCVEKFESSPPGWYDAILMDLRMPVMTGLEAARVLRRSSRPDARSVPIIAVSADAFQEDVQRCLECGMNDHTAKPLEPEKVLALLCRYLDGEGGAWR